MSFINLILFFALVVSFGWALNMGYQGRKRKQANNLVAKELDLIIQNVLESVKKTKKYMSKTMLSEGAPDVTSPQMLSTLVTVLVNKIGTINLSLADFAGVPEDEYVSVYVDDDSKEIILSMNHQLGEINSYMVSFGDPDDNTFH